jgi:predicted AAA+ superfamily ATPase
LTSALVKAPKLHWVDIGLLRHGLAQWGPLTGEQFESFIVVEIHKWVSTSGHDARLSFYRTRSGMEVDLLIETAAGALGVEIKQRAQVYPKDLRGLAALASAFGRAWRGGLVVYQGDDIRQVDPAHDIWAVPAHRLLR